MPPNFLVFFWKRHGRLVDILLLFLPLLSLLNLYFPCATAFVLPSAVNSPLPVRGPVLYSTKYSKESSFHTSNQPNLPLGSQTHNIRKQNSNRQFRNAKDNSNLIKQWKNRQDYIEGMTQLIQKNYTQPGSLSQSDAKWKEAYSVLCSWSKFASLAPNRAPIAMEQLIKRLLQERQYQLSQSSNINPDDMIEIPVGTYISLLHAWAERAIKLKDQQAAHRAYEVLVALQDMHESGDAGAPGTRFFGLVFKTLCQGEDATVARRALGWMENLYKTNKNQNAKLPLYYYTLMLDKYATSNKPNAGVLAEAFIRHMHRTGIVEPTTICYNIAIKAWTKSIKFHGRFEVAKHAQRIMKEMQVPKDTSTYATVLAAWSNSGMKDQAVSHAEALLQQVKEDPNISPDTILMNIVMATLSRSGNPEACNRIMELLQYMEQESTNNPNISPNLISYNTLLHSLAAHSKNCFENAKQADELLTRLEQMSDNGQASFKPDEICYHLVIDAWLAQAALNDDDYSKNNVRDQEKNELAARNALQVLQKLQSRDNGLETRITWFGKITKVVTRCTNPKAAAELAEKLLICMEVYRTNTDDKGNKHVLARYTSLIASWAQQYKIPNISALLKKQAFNRKSIAMSTTSRPFASRDTILMEQWEHRQDYIEGMTQHFCNDYPKLGSLALNGRWNEAYSLLCSWSKYSSLVPRRAPVAMDQLVRRLLQERRFQQTQSSSINQDGLIEVPSGMYNTILYTMTNKATKFQSNHAARRAREMLVFLQELYESGNVEAPNAKSFNLVYKCAYNMEDVKTTRRVLAWMEYLYKTKKNVNAKPTLSHYNWMLDKYANSQQANAGVLAEALLRHMQHTGVAEPSTGSYSTVVKAWSKSSKFHEKGEAAKRADQIMMEMKAPKDIILYASVLTAWADSGMKDFAASRVEELLSQIKQDPNVTLNVVIINVVMATWLRSGNPKAIDRTRELLQEMEHESTKHGSDSALAPDLISYNTHLNCLCTYAKHSLDYAKEADAILTKLEEMNKNGLIPFKPDGFTYHLVITAWLAQASKNGDDDVQNQERNELVARNALRVLQKFNSCGYGRRLTWVEKIEAVSKKCSESVAQELAKELEECKSDTGLKRV